MTGQRIEPAPGRAVLQQLGSMTPGVMMGGLSLASACRRRVAPLLVQFPPFGCCEVAVRGGEVAVRGGEVEVQGGMVPKVQTTSAKNADNRLSWAKWSAFWAKLSRTWCVARTRTRYSVR